MTEKTFVDNLCNFLGGAVSLSHLSSVMSSSCCMSVCVTGLSNAFGFFFTHLLIVFQDLLSVNYHLNASSL